MVRWLAIGIIVVVVLVGGYYISGQERSQVPPPQKNVQNQQSSVETLNGSQDSSENTITLTSSGFSPKSLTIKAGTKVTWINNSGRNATISSNPHPVHTEHPFLNLGPFSDGEKHTLTFDKPGSYGYHDHFNAESQGTIIVQ
jgi:plastocyanin